MATKPISGNSHSIGLAAWRELSGVRDAARRIGKSSDISTEKKDRPAATSKQEEKK